MPVSTHSFLVRMIEFQEFSSASTSPSLHGEHDVGGAGIAGNDLELGAGEGVQQPRIAFGRRRRAGAAGDGFIFADVLDVLGFRGVPADHRFQHGGHAADIGEFGRLVLHARGLERLFQHHGLGHHRERGAVLGRDIVEIIRRPQAAGARHGLHHDERIARDVPPHVVREQARVEIVAAARREADIEVDGGALVEGFHRLLRQRRIAEACGRHAERCRQQCPRAASKISHDVRRPVVRCTLTRLRPYRHEQICRAMRRDYVRCGSVCRVGKRRVFAPLPTISQCGSPDVVGTLRFAHPTALL